ncbi:MAG: hypothetical protein KKC19_02935 [Nanoarchaeota archaeon]|nr:hypothetical protein [Nanoarchaeota archaeon]
MKDKELEKRLERIQILDKEIVAKQKNELGEENVIFYLPKRWEPKVYEVLEVYDK